MDASRFVRLLSLYADSEAPPAHWLLDPDGVPGLELPPDVLEQLSWTKDVRLDRTAAEVRRTVLFGAARAARAGLDARPAAEQRLPVCTVDAELAAAAFRGAAAVAPLALDLLLAAFVPTVIVYPDAPVRRASSALWHRERSSSRESGNGLVVLGARAGHVERRVAGEVHFLPPVRRGEMAARRAWVERNDLGPPSRRGMGGAYWMLGETEQWRLGNLGWRERLVLAGAIATRLPVCAVVGGPTAVPRAGYVVQRLELMQRTIVHVPWEALPEELEQHLLATCSVCILQEGELDWGRENS